MSLEPISVSDFSGGLNVDRPRGTTDDYSVTGSESPEMLNIEIDPRGGIYTRLGWHRWNATDIDTPASWDPKGAHIHPMSNGGYIIYIANGTTVFEAEPDGVFADMSIAVGANPHLADFASWGDTCYIACGTGNLSYRRIGTAAAASIADAALGFNDTYTAPTGGRMPKCEFIKGHTGYIFCAGTTEGGVLMPNRLRWSHPDEPEDWHSLDYLDINVGGGRITGLKSFQDHLLVFKTDSVWAIYGYDSASWQLVRVSMHTGAPSPMAITRSETAVYFYSAASQGAIYAYNGSDAPIHVSANLRFIMEETTDHEAVSLGWTEGRLWCSIPWEPGDGDNPGSVLVWNPDVNGAWVLHRPALGKIATIIEDADIHSGYPMGVIDGSSGAAAVMRLHHIEGQAIDIILEDETLSPFTANFRTGWIHAGWPERRKSWRRPRYIFAKPPQQVAIRVDVFWDYDSASAMRTGTVTLDSTGEALWGGGAEWGDGTIWGEQQEGSRIDRSDTGRGLGVSRSIAIEFSTDASTPGKTWNLNEMTLKYLLRRFTT